MSVGSQIASRPTLSGARPTAVRRWPHMSDDSLSFGELMRRWRKAKNMGQEQLAELAGTDKSTISEIEGDPSRKPGHDLALRIISSLEAPAEPFVRALGYPLAGEPRTWERAAGDAVVGSDLTEEIKQALLEVIKMANAQLAASEPEVPGRKR